VTRDVRPSQSYSSPVANLSIDAQPGSSERESYFSSSAGAALRAKNGEAPVTPANDMSHTSANGGGTKRGD